MACFRLAEEHRLPNSELLVEATLDNLRVAFPLREVQRVIRAVATTPVPGANACLMGMVDVHGLVVPVFDTRVLLGLPARGAQPCDHFILFAGPRPRAFLVDEVGDVFDGELPAPPRSFAADASGLRGVVRREDGVVLVHDMKRFMAFDEAIALASHA